MSFMNPSLTHKPHLARLMDRVRATRDQGRALRLPGATNHKRTNHWPERLGCQKRITPLFVAFG